LKAVATTQTVTVLFTDLVGSTELSSRLGPEAADALRQTHFGLLRGAIQSAGGTEVKNLGDGLMVALTSLSRALACAVAMQQAIERHNRREDTAVLSVRIGISTGEATEEEGDYFGDPVIEAARLCAKADGGQILASDLVRLHVGRRGDHTFRQKGILELKGLPEPVAAWEVAWEPAPIEVFPLPTRLDSITTSFGFQGRTRELDRLGAAYKATAGGDRRRIVLISGEPGIGKTSLAAALAGSVLEQGAVVLYGRCDEDLGIPYQPWVEALDHLVRIGPPSLFDNLLPTRVAELARLVPEITDRTGVAVSRTVADESERYLLFGAVVDLLSRCSEIAPTLLVLDDLHWADGPTVQLLRHVISAQPPIRLCVIGTYRDSELGVEHPLTDALAVLHREAGVERFSLTGLGDDELLALLENYAGHEILEDGLLLRDALLAETGGNPFFVREILRHLAETGVIAQGDTGRWETHVDLTASGLPVSVREVIGHRVGRLGRTVAQWLTTAAVVGRDFDVDLLANVVQIDQEELTIALEAAVQAGILVEGETPGQFSFAHALFEHSLYRDLSSLRRARAHRAVAEAIEDECQGNVTSRIGELAYHWARATQLQEPQKAIKYAQLAGDRALQQLAPDEAIRWYSDALQMLERQNPADTQLRASLLVGLGDAQRQTGDPNHRETLLEAARLADAVEDTATLVKAALANNRGFHSSTGSGDEERVSVLRRALDRLGEVNTPERAWLLAILSAETLHFLQFDERLELAKAAVQCARRAGDRTTLADVLVRSHEAISMPETLELRSAWAQEACELVETDHGFLRWLTHGVRAIVALEAADLPKMRKSLRVFDEEATQIGQPVCQWVHCIYQSWYHILLGDLAGAEEFADKALSLGLETGQPDAMLLYGSQLFDIRFCQGRLGELVPIIEQLMHDYPGPTIFRSLQCLAVAESGDLDEARRLLDRDAACHFEIWQGAPSVTANVAWTIAAWRCGYVEAAQILYDRLSPWHHQMATIGITAAMGCIARFLALLADLMEEFDLSEGWFNEALEIDQSMESPIHIAWTKTAWANMLARRNRPGDKEDAIAMLDEALAMARDGQFARVEQDVLGAQHLLLG
jgi:class 3 adenylate cyclase/tetratricopeptide (TPR) repeat protein